MSRTLFISFTRLIYALRHKETSIKEFNDGLFFFGCTREHVMSQLPSEAEYDRAKASWNYAYSKEFAMREWFVWNKEVPYKETLQYAKALQKALTKAESEGRVVWRQKGDTDEWNKLFTLLRNFGVVINPEVADRYDYCYPIAVELISPHMKVIG